MKPRVAFFDFASCEGCQLAILNCEDILLDILGLVEIVEFREAISDKAQRYDVAFIEGSVNREIDHERLQDIRSRSKILVALGACACTGNVQARSNLVAPAENFKSIYGEDNRNRVQIDEEYWELWSHTRVRPISAVVPVDFYLRGCPVVPAEFLALTKALILGSTPSFAPNAVCVECKKNENECVLDQGRTCMGPISWGGCNAVCVNGGHVCDGCRGTLPHANEAAHWQLMREKGIDDELIRSRYRLFCASERIAKGV
jgi:coenzyme F420-reducing hydrogenase gamma subunit